ncbi:MAG: DNA polymerase III subunit alpha [Selenomonadaceae bacterium]|nr:DNA polymerase III subunit alpha [Selenomonadaceae bacterium]
MNNFVHLHVHTEYSLLDGAARIGNLLDAVKNFEMNAIAITDHGTMYGTIDFYKAAKKRGIKPIIGCEVYLAPDSRHNRNYNDTKYFHLVLLAENNVGYQNLIKLVSLASLEGFYYKPRVDKELLRQYHEGIIALSACVNGEIQRAILEGNLTRAVELTEEYAAIFGQDNFFLEIQNHGLDEEKIVNEELIKISRQLNIGLVATNDVHYVKQSDSAAHDVLLCLQTNKLLTDENRLKFPSDDYYLKSPAQMYELFSDTPEACENTVKIAERCNVEFNFGEMHLPEFSIPIGYANSADYLNELCRKKIYDRYDLPDEKIFARLNYELDTIKRMGYADYFLVVQDFIDYAKKNNIAVGPGRGSATGSLVAYVLGITDIDPFKFDLIFERFLNPERVTMPDIDIDFCYLRREEVIDYVKKTYGESHVAQIVTFGTMAAKAAIRDVTRVLNIPYATGSRLVDMIPNELKITLDKALETSPKLKADYENNPQTRRIIDLARELEGLPRHASVHAAGIVISKLPLIDYVPLQNLKGTIVTQFDKDKIEELGLLKMDFLGLRTLTIIDDARNNIRKNSGVEIDISTIPTDDEATAKMLSSGDTGAVFQMESAGMTKLVRDLKPTCFQDLIPTIALFRPGPLGSGMVKDFIDGKHGLRKPVYLHPKLEPILRETYGVILYQEQVMQIVQALAGFTLGQADILRRAMAKKKISILAAQKENFLKGCMANGIEISLAEKIFGLLEHFADYGFNKSHSAAYGWLAWQTAYLKAHYPAEYIAATLSSVMDSDKIAVYIDLAKRMGIKILTPDVNSSGVKFQAEENKIYFALSAVKNLGESAIKGVVEVRETGGRFKSLTDFCMRIDLKKFTSQAVENLIRCGAFDSINNNRAALLKVSEQILSFARMRNGGENLLFDSTKSFEAEEKNISSKIKTSKKNCLDWERETLGFYISGHPLEDFSKILENFKGIADIKGENLTAKTTVKIGGLLTDYRQIMTKNHEPMAFITIEDFQDNISVVIFPKIFMSCEEFLIEEKVLVIEGKTDFSRGEINILADKVTPIENYVPNLYLIDEPDNLNTAQILKKIFNENQGDSSIYLRRQGKWKPIKYKISITDEVLTQLKNLLGVENVRIY